jgi:hypothetical protein
VPKYILAEVISPQLRLHPNERPSIAPVLPQASWELEFSAFVHAVTWEFEFNGWLLQFNERLLFSGWSLQL